MTIPMRRTMSRYRAVRSVRRPQVDAPTLWAGGAATAVVAALIALVGILVSRWLFKVPILAPQPDGAWGDASTGGYVFAAAAVALAATAIMHLLLIATPKPRVVLRLDHRAGDGDRGGVPVQHDRPAVAEVRHRRGQPGARHRDRDADRQVSPRVGRRVVSGGYDRPTSPPTRTPGDGYC